MTSSNKPPRHNPFANKSDLEAAQRRIAALEAENRALKAGTTAQAPTASKPAPARSITTTAQEWQPAAKPQISKASFDKLTPADRMDFIKAGGKITN
jgi:cell division septation protein DedD